MSDNNFLFSPLLVKQKETRGVVGTCTVRVPSLCQYEYSCAVWYDDKVKKKIQVPGEVITVFFPPRGTIKICLRDSIKTHT